MRMKQPELRKARIEIIPMIDTIFFLLVFFMVTWLTMVKMNGLQMLLPRRTLGTAKPPFSVVLSLSPSGKYYLDSRPAEAGLWAAHLRQRLEAHPNSVVVVNVAAAQKTQTLISLLDSVNHVIADSHSHAQVLIATPRVVPTGQENSHGK
jgi:biopolymer transport protein ExbD